MGSEAGIANRHSSEPLPEPTGGATAEPPADATGFLAHGLAPAVAEGPGTSRPSASDLGYSDGKDAQLALHIAADIVQHGYTRMLAQAPLGYALALHALADALSGQRDGVKVSGAERVKLFERSRRGLAPAIELYGESDAGKVWLQQELLEPLALEHDRLAYAAAEQRVESSILLTENGTQRILEIPDDAHPREQGQVLRSQIRALVGAMGQLHEQAAAIGLPAIEAEIERIKEGHGGLGGASSLHDLQAMLMLADGYLTLTDEEFHHELHHVQGIAKVATYSEYVKAVTELVGTCLTASGLFTAAIAKVAGDPHLAAQAAGLTREAFHELSGIVAGIEIVRGLAIAADRKAQPQKRLDAALDVASGGASLVAELVEPVTAGAIGLSAGLTGAYAELTFLATQYWAVQRGLVGAGMSSAFEAMRQDGESIAWHADALAKSGALIAREHDPQQLEALHRVEVQMAIALGESVDYFLDNCQRRDGDRHPGAHAILVETFSRLAPFRGAKTPQAAARAGSAALARISWALEHASQLVNAEVKHEQVAAVEAPARGHE